MNGNLKRTGGIISACIFPILFPSHHPRHPFLRLDELVPVEPLVQLSERFAAVSLDTVLGRQLLERRSELRERNLY